MSESKLQLACKMSFEEENAQFEERLKKDYIKILRERSKMSLKQFSEYFNIPYRTLQHWEAGDRQCPVYVLELIEYKLRNEGFFNKPLSIILGNDLMKEIKTDIKKGKRKITIGEV